jgi:hypothetical protein
MSGTDTPEDEPPPEDDEATEPEVEDTADIPDNPVAALERIFSAIRNSGQPTVGGAWEKALGADLGTQEFVSRHSEVVGLVRWLQSYLTALPAGSRLKERHEKKPLRFYDAVVYREKQWNDPNATASQTLIIDTDIDALGDIADILDARSIDTKLSGSELAQLRSTLDDWLVMLDDAGIPDDLKLEIRTQIDRIRWLLSCSDLLGHAAVILENQSLLSKGLTLFKVASDTVGVANCVVSLFQIVGHISARDYGQAANALTAGFSSIGEALEITRRPQALPNIDEAAAIEEKPSGDGFIDAEVVDDVDDDVDDSGTRA